MSDTGEKKHGTHGNGSCKLKIPLAIKNFITKSDNANVSNNTNNGFIIAIYWLWFKYKYRGRLRQPYTLGLNGFSPTVQAYHH